MRSQKLWLLILNITFNMVMGFILPVNMIFINKNLNQPLTTAGFSLMVYSGFMMLGNALGGVLFDKISKKWTLQIGYIIAVISLLGMTVHHIWPSYLFMLVMLGFGMGISYTAINAYTAFVAEQTVGDSRVLFNNMYLAANMGIAIGSTAVGFIFEYSVFLTFFIPVILFVLCILIVFFKANLLDATNEEAEKTHEYHVSAETADPKEIIGGRRYLTNLIIISLGVFVMWMGYTQWDSNMSVYMLNEGFSKREYSIVFTVNAGSLLLIQPIMNRIMSKMFKLLKHQILVGIIIMGLSFLILPNANKYWMFIVSMLILTVGESMVFPTIPALLNKMSTSKNRGSLQSLYTIMGSLGRAIGPYAGSIIVTVLSFGNLFYGITAAMIVVALSLNGVKELEK
ncbi:MFS transporter [Companilactobacillus ginsenosidimutans]|uniref:MFS transporter permease n=1 Tax=Companilactobacillus ginsenosidimutans TaxID=1007676 RepID=A0A0H4QGU3_9LACO|nr:MFS transporter [Companilactobacillus ginsenosidimutans]AKP67629.1 MFS transporter permease [Companilactobacillus ginsenosidimutans]